MMYIEGQWVLECGGDLPVNHGASWELLLEAASIESSPAKDLFLQEERVRILPEGSALRILMDVRDWSSISDEQVKYLLHWEGAYPRPFLHPSPDHRFVEVHLSSPSPHQSTFLSSDRGGLWLRVQGVSAIGLGCSGVTLPACLSARPAQSLNHAYTVLSEIFEPWRTSHTGSVYRHVFYREADGSWHPLRLLRDSYLSEKSHQIAHELWQQMLHRSAKDITNNDRA
ncbi:hypothetical protein [Qipengyuania sp. 902]|uniref:hypothetical protein n=1 Tax=Qipengyuania sp. 902 TaxID=3417565 RepID=UPI003EB78B55